MGAKFIKALIYSFSYHLTGKLEERRKNKQKRWRKKNKSNQQHTNSKVLYPKVLENPIV